VQTLWVGYHSSCQRLIELLIASGMDFPVLYFIQFDAGEEQWVTVFKGQIYFSLAIATIAALTS